MKKESVLVLLLCFFFNVNNLFAGWIDEINKLPSIGDAAIQSGTLVVFPDPSNISESNYRKLGKMLCINSSAQGFNMVRIMDSIEYLNSGKFKVHSRISC